MPGSQNLQDIFLNACRKENAQVTVFLKNGFQFNGVVKAFDSFTVLLLSGGKQMMVYKHAISTVIPAERVAMEQVEEKAV
ncbi:MAG: RNA chaperone Hfq [Clostridia bacterium]|nr:RNA chaperone Hfq [Clostridia bacterium]